MNKLDVVGLCGSLRKASFNHAALRLAGELMPASMSMEILDWRDLPMYDEDLQAQGMPKIVLALGDRIRRAQGIVIATPEYNFSLPGSFKNAIDWLSRVKESPLAGKPVALLSASAGPVGGARMQYDLRKVLLSLGTLPLAKPEVFIGLAQTKFDAQGGCGDEPTRGYIGAQMQAFETWIAVVARMQAR